MELQNNSSKTVTFAITILFLTGIMIGMTAGRTLPIYLDNSSNLSLTFKSYFLFILYHYLLNLAIYNWVL